MSTEIKNMKMSKELDEDEAPALDEADLSILETYSRGPFTKEIRQTEANIRKLSSKIDQIRGILDTDTGLAPMSQWDLDGDKLLISSQDPLSVAMCEKKHY